MRICWYVIRCTLGTNFLRNVLAAKGVIRAANGTIRAEEETARPGQDF